MITIGLKLTRTDSPGDVCHHSGTTKADCPHRCGTYCEYQRTNPRPTPCNLAWVACPNPQRIYTIEAPAIRETWPTCRLDKQELREWNMDIPEATRVWDHMRRKAEGDQQR